MNRIIQHQDPVAQRPARTGVAFLLLLLILIAAAALRLHDLGRQSFWCDEFLSAEMTAGRGYQHEQIPVNSLILQPPELTSLREAAPWWSVWTHQIDEAYPPLYVLLARFWRYIAGDGDVALRLFSVIASLTMLLLLFDAVRVKHGDAPALWAAAIAAVAIPQIAYAQEARGYALLLAAGAGACAAITRLEQKGPGVLRAVGLGVAVAAMLFTHYYAYGAVAILGGYALLRLPGRARQHAVAALIAAGAVAAALWGPFALQQINSAHVAGTQMYFGDSGPGQIGRLLTRCALLPIHYFYEPMPRDRSIALVGGVTYILMIVLAWKRRDLRLWVAWFFASIVPVALIDLLAPTRQLDELRYTLLAAPAAYAIAAAAPATLNRKVRFIIPLLIVLACVLSMGIRPPAKSNWRAVAREWAATARPGDVTVFSGSSYAGPYSPSLTYLSTSFYRRPTGPIVLLEHRADPELMAKLKASPGAILVASWLSPEPGELLPGCVAERIGFEPFVARVYRLRLK